VHSAPDSITIPLPTVLGMEESLPAGADFDSLRSLEFAELGSCIFLNAASFAPIPARTRRTVERFHALRASACDLDETDLVRALDRARGAAAELIGAAADEIALGWNASFGINLAALTLPVEPGSSIVVSAREFPANVYPWMGRRDTQLEIIPTDPLGRPDEERIMERLSSGGVSVFALSSVQFASGYRADLERLGGLCRENGIFFVVDAIQSLGQLPLDVRAANVDILATGGHKWLCSPFGTGFAYVRRELVERLEPRWVGWTGLEASSSLESLVDYRWVFRSDARRFEGGTLPFDSFAGLAEAVELFLELGVENIQRRLAALLHPLIEWLHAAPEIRIVSELSPARRSAILSFQPPNADHVYQRLVADGIVCSLREGGIRIAPHLYNTADEIGRVIEVLQALKDRRWS
jgi:cysteine desulfurase / selenocysteine lyase